MDMKPSFPFTLKQIDRFLENRYFQFVLWTVALGLAGFIGFSMMQGNVHRVELALLDWRMRFRAFNLESPETAASKDIVILGIDGNTDKFIRMHPEYGLSLKPPQRNRLAKVLDYLTDQGAKAVIFDLEFKDAKPKEDEALVKAIRRNGRVYSADRMDYAMDLFKHDQLQSIQVAKKQEPRHFLNVFLFEGMFRPYITYLFNVRSRLMPLKSVGLMDLGLGPVYRPFPEMEPWIQLVTHQLNFSSQPLSSSLLFPLPKPQSSSYKDLMDRVYSEWCLNNNYTQSFPNNVEFLRRLDQSRLNVNLDRPLPEKVERAISNCYTFPTVASIMSALTSIGVPSIKYDEDAYIRSVSVLYRGYRGNFYTYLGIRPVLDLLNINTISYNENYLMLDNRRIPLIDGEKAIINWRSPKWLVKQMIEESAPYLTPEEKSELEYSKDNEVISDRNNPLLGGGHVYRQISLIDVLRMIDKEKMRDDELGRLYNIPYHSNSKLFSFKDKIVVIGDTVTDIHRTPMSNTMFGPEVVAAVLDMFLHDRVFVEHVPMWLQWSLIGGIAIGMAVIILTFENLAVGFLIGIIMVLLYWLISGMAFIHSLYVLDLVGPTVVLMIALILITYYRNYIHDREKHHLTNVFSKYVSPQIMSEIVKNPERALDNLKGGKKELTVLFSDLQGFTHQFENADPELMVSQLNEYFDVMTEIILNYGGTYDKYMGDSIMAFFGAPADVPAHAEMACRAAMEMQNALQELNANWAQEGSKLLSHGIGISSGEMFVGNFGSRNIKNFTVMGSNVNLGARLEAYTRVAHWPIIISERTWELAKDQIKVRDLGCIQVKGFTDSVQIYGLEDVVPSVEELLPQVQTQMA
jgi:class 3 adenylate cyclase/CHASE2 domain-containing sensor protein